MPTVRTCRSNIRWAEGRPERLPELAADLVAGPHCHRDAGEQFFTPARLRLGRSQSCLCVPGSSEIGLVENLARPGGNITGVIFFTIEIVANRPGLLREMVPALTGWPFCGSGGVRDRPTWMSRPNRRAIGHASQSSLVPAILTRSKCIAFVSMGSRTARIRAPGRVTSTPARPTRHAGVSLSDSGDLFSPDYVVAGGLMTLWAEHHGHVSSGWRLHRRVLQGEKPADLPVLQPTNSSRLLMLAPLRLSDSSTHLNAILARRGDRMRKREFLTSLRRWY